MAEMSVVFYHSNGSAIETRTYTQNISESFTMFFDVSFVHVETTSETIGTFSLHLLVNGQIQLASSGVLLKNYTVVQITAPYTEIYTFEATENYDVQLWDSSGNTITGSPNGPTTLTIS